jgi:hypothetical protein
MSRTELIEQAQRIAAGQTLMLPTKEILRACVDEINDLRSTAASSVAVGSQVDLPNMFYRTPADTINQEKLLAEIAETLHDIARMLSDARGEAADTLPFPSPQPEPSDAPMVNSEPEPAIVEHDPSEFSTEAQENGV